MRQSTAGRAAHRTNIARQEYVLCASKGAASDPTIGMIAT